MPWQREAMMVAEPVRFRLDGEAVAITTAPDRKLVDILREDCGRMAVKEACGIGRCGACMVLLDGRAVNSCLVMAFQAEGLSVVTPAGLDAMPEAAAVRAALIEEVSFQCGYCAPGFTVALTALLLFDRNPDRAAIRTALEGNICRCTGYHSILRGAEAAVLKLAALDKGAEQGSPA